MTLSQSDLYTLAKKAGLPDSNAKVAAAIAMAESGGDPNAHNTNKSTGDDSYGLWQINMLGDMGPERRKRFGILADGQLIDPTQNAKAMAILSQQGRVWTDWSTYNSGAYKKFMTNTVTDTGKDYNQSNFERWTGIDTTIDSGNPLTTINNALSKTGAWVSDSKNWIRVAYVVGGGALVLGALVTLASGTKLGSLATSLTPPGKAAQVAKTVKKVM